MRQLAFVLFAALLAAPAAAQPDAIVPFKIQVPDAVLSDLKQRLGQARFPDELSGTGWNYGTDLAYLRQLTAYWRDRYDWRAQERRLNELPQFKTRIDGLDIHFVHWRSRVPKWRSAAQCATACGDARELGNAISRQHGRPQVGTRHRVQPVSSRRDGRANGGRVCRT